MTNEHDHGDEHHEDRGHHEHQEDDSRDEKSWWATTWPIDTHRTKQLVIALVATVAVGALVGATLFRWLEPNALTELDDRIADWFVDQRTESWTTAATWGAFVANTGTKIVASILIAGFALWKWRRWHEAVLIGLTLIFEATAFIVMSTIVGRPRPDVEALLDSPVDTSFPSGHVAAATVYAAFAVIVFWHTRALWARALAVVLSIAAPVIVGSSRMYQGMHFFFDVVGGIVLGAVSMVICVRILGAPHDAVSLPVNSEREPDRRPDAAAA